MSFDVTAGAYDGFMGRHSALLAPGLVEFAGVRPEHSAIDVGCGPGALTGELVRLLGATRSRRWTRQSRWSRRCALGTRGGRAVAVAEDLPFPDNTFDAAIAELVVHLMADPVAGLAEMARVTNADGVVAACVWDFAGERAPISAFWRAAREIDERPVDESGLAGARPGHLSQLFTATGLRRVEEEAIQAPIAYGSFDDWWEPSTLGVGPAGAYAQGLAPALLSAVRARCRQFLPDGPFTLTAHAWGRVGPGVNEHDESRMVLEVDTTEDGQVPGEMARRRGSQPGSSISRLSSEAEAHIAWSRTRAMSPPRRSPGPTPGTDRPPGGAGALVVHEDVCAFRKQGWPMTIELPLSMCASAQARVRHQHAGRHVPGSQRHPPEDLRNPRRLAWSAGFAGPAQDFSSGLAQGPLLCVRAGHRANLVAETEGTALAPQSRRSGDVGERPRVGSGRLTRHEACRRPRPLVGPQAPRLVRRLKAAFRAAFAIGFDGW